MGGHRCIGDCIESGIDSKDMGNDKHFLTKFGTVVVCDATKYADAH